MEEASGRGPPHESGEESTDGPPAPARGGWPVSPNGDGLSGQPERELAEWALQRARTHGAE
eukprot:15437670-Alexandrium_andersonii.AAC.1